MSIQEEAEHTSSLHIYERNNVRQRQHSVTQKGRQMRSTATFFCVDVAGSQADARSGSWIVFVKCSPKLEKNCAASFLAVESMRRLPSWAILPPTSALTT